MGILGRLDRSTHFGPSRSNSYTLISIRSAGGTFYISRLGLVAWIIERIHGICYLKDYNPPEPFLEFRTGKNGCLEG